MATKPVKKRTSVLKSKGGASGEAYTLWSAVDWPVVAHLVVTVSRAGGTVQLGTTQNGSAATIRIYHAGEGETFYAGDTEGIEDLCRYWAEQFADHNE